MVIEQTQTKTASTKENACNVYSKRLNIAAQDGTEFSVRHMRFLTENTMQARYGAFRVYNQESQDIGFLKYTYTYDDGEGMCVHLDEMYFENAYRNRGLGTAVLSLGLMQADLRGVHRIEGELHIPAEVPARTRARILSFYQKNGFQIIGGASFCKTLD